MDLSDALAELPDEYSAALRLRLAGASDLAIAAQLDVDPEAVTALLRIASAKLSTLLDEEPTR